MLETIFCRSFTLYLTRFIIYKIARPPQTKTQEGRGPLTDKHLRKVQVIFLYDDILLWCLYCYLVLGVDGLVNNRLIGNKYSFYTCIIITYRFKDSRKTKLSIKNNCFLLFDLFVIDFQEKQKKTYLHTHTTQFNKLHFSRK